MPTLTPGCTLSEKVPVKDIEELGTNLEFYSFCDVDILFETKSSFWKRGCLKLLVRGPAPGLKLNTRHLRRFERQPG